MDCIFCKIVNKELPAKIVFEDDDLLAFYDLAPKAKIHILVIPKKHIDSVNDLSQSDSELIGRLFLKIKEIAQKLGVDQTGYRVITNTGPDSGQIVHHLHFHLVGGGKLGPIA
jgi:histidine triad (HIT) family protein